jgi:hypothetical protein
LCIFLFAASLPISVGQRILIGLDRNHLVTIFQAIGPIFILASLFCARAVFSAHPSYIPVLFYASNLVVGVVALVAAANSPIGKVGTSVLHDLLRVNHRTECNATPPGQCLSSPSLCPLQCNR